MRFIKYFLAFAAGFYGFFIWFEFKNQAKQYKGGVYLWVPPAPVDEHNIAYHHDEWLEEMREARDAEQNPHIVTEDDPASLTRALRWQNEHPTEEEVHEAQFDAMNADYLRRRAQEMIDERRAELWLQENPERPDFGVFHPDEEPF